MSALRRVLLVVLGAVAGWWLAWLCMVVVLVPPALVFGWRIEDTGGLGALPFVAVMLVGAVVGAVRLPKRVGG